MRNSTITATVERNAIVDNGIRADRRAVVVVSVDTDVVGGGMMVRAAHTPTRYLYAPQDFTSKRGDEIQRDHQPGRLCLALSATPALAPTAAAAASLAAASWRAPRALSSRRREALASQLARFRG